MSQWVGVARTNYVAIEDMKGLLNSIKRFTVSFECGEGVYQNKWAFFGLEDGWPSVYDEVKDEEILFSFKEHVMPYVTEGEVLIAMEAGYVGSKCVTGAAIAYRRKGDKVSGIRIALADIYDKAKLKFETEEFSKAEN